jgi:hypothetical protein
MRIDDLPRPWLLAAMAGVPMSALLERAERERDERAEEARKNAVREHHRHARWSVAERPAIHLPFRLAS